MDAQLPSEQQPPPPKAKGLTSVQIGAGIGAAVTVLVLLVVRDLSHSADEGFLSNFFLGVWTAIGAMAGMAVVALVRLVLQQKTSAELRDNQRAVTAGDTGGAVQPALPPDSPSEGNGARSFGYSQDWQRCYSQELRP